MKTKIFLFIFIIGLVTLSIYQGAQISRFFAGLNSAIIEVYLGFTDNVKNKISEHFMQADQIANLREKNAELEHSANLLSTFASQLNSMLKDKNASEYAPQIQLIRALGYVNISDYNKIFMSEFEGYDAGKIYGLMHHGKSAGVLVSREGRAVALLQNDPKSIFAVFIGENKVPGIAHGTKSGVVIKFIPQWLSVNIGDEVFTSGLDGIFFSGVPVGKVTEVFKESSYYSAAIEPYMKDSAPNFLYVITKDK